MGVWVTVLILVAISIFLYCCVRVGAEADRQMKKFFSEQDDKINIIEKH